MIDDIGPRPQAFDLERATRDNENYRTVAWSGRYLQVTLMSIPVGADIGLEAHPDTDQFLRLDAGQGRVRMGESRENLTFDRVVTDGWFLPTLTVSDPQVDVACAFVAFAAATAQNS